MESMFYWILDTGDGRFTETMIPETSFEKLVEKLGDQEKIKSFNFFFPIKLIEKMIRERDPLVNHIKQVVEMCGAVLTENSVAIQKYGAYGKMDGPILYSGSHMASLHGNKEGEFIYSFDQVLELVEQ